MIRVWRAESRGEICQSNWSKRLESCFMVHATDALIAERRFAGEVRCGIVKLPRDAF